MMNYDNKIKNDYYEYSYHAKDDVKEEKSSNYESRLDLS